MNDGGRAVPESWTIAKSLERLVRLHTSASYRQNLRPTQWQVLRHIAHAPPEERTLTRIAEHRATTMGTASSTVSQLVARGLLVRGAQNASRNVGLQVTAAGRAALEHDPLSEVAAAIDRLPHDTRDHLFHALQALCDDLERDGGTGSTGGTGGT